MLPSATFLLPNVTNQCKWYQTFLVLQYDERLNKFCVKCAYLKFYTLCNSRFVGLDSWHNKPKGWGEYRGNNADGS